MDLSNSDERGTERRYGLVLKLSQIAELNVVVLGTNMGLESLTKAMVSWLSRYYGTVDVALGLK